MNTSREILDFNNNIIAGEGIQIEGIGTLYSPLKIALDANLPSLPTGFEGEVLTFNEFDELISAPISWEQLSHIPELQSIVGGSEGTANSISLIEDELLTKVTIESGMGLSETSYTQAEKTKLSTIRNRFAGRFNSLAQLNAITGVSGDEAYVSIDGAPIVVYVWDTLTSAWQSSLLAAGEESPETIKTKYESNPDTNAYSNSEKTKLAGIASQATKNDTDANLKNRANHTGVQPMSSITGLTTYIDKLGLISKTTASAVTTREYVDRFEYTAKSTISSFSIPAAGTAYPTGSFLPVGVTIAGCDEFIVTQHSEQSRNVNLTVRDGSDRRLVVEVGNITHASLTWTGTVFVKLVKYK